MKQKETEEIIATQARMRQQMEEQQQTLRDLYAWEDLIQKQQLVQNQSPKVQQANMIPNQRHTDHQSTRIKSNSETAKIKMGDTTKEGNTLNEEEERNRGNAFYSKGNYDEAIRCYSKCISKNPTSVLAYSNRAMAYLKVKDWVHAEEDTTTALNIDPLHTKSYQRRSVARTSLGKLRAALQDLNMAQEAATKTGVTSASKEIAMEKQKIESMLIEAMEKAPKRKVPIQLVPQSVSNKDEKNGTSNPSPVEDDDGEIRAIHTTRRKPMNSEAIIDHTALQADVNKKNTQHFSPKNPESTQQISNKDEKTNNSSSSSSSPPPSLPTPTKKCRTWYEFEQVWRCNSSNRVHLLQSLKPQELTLLYKRNGMEDSNIFLELMECICHNILEPDTKISYIIALSRIPSIDMVVMMLSKTEHDVVRKLLDESFLLYPSPDIQDGVWKRFGLS